MLLKKGTSLGTSPGTIIIITLFLIFTITLTILFSLLVNETERMMNKLTQDITKIEQRLDNLEFNNRWRNSRWGKN